MRARVFWIVLAIILSVFAQPFAVQAANIWDGGGGDDNWGTGLNWDDNLVPLWPQPLTFAGATRLTPNNNLSGIAVSSITFDAAAGAFVIGGNATGLNGDIVNNATAAQAINLPLTLNATPNISVVDPTGALTLGGVISGGFGLTKTGPGTLTLTGANTFSGPINIGTTTAPGGTVVVGTGGSLGNGTNALTLGGTNTPNTGNLTLSGNSATVSSLTVATDTLSTFIPDPPPGIYPANTISISPGRTLTVTGNVLVGGLTNPGTGTGFNPVTVLKVTGGGNLVAGSGTGGTFLVGNNKVANAGGTPVDAIQNTAMDLTGTASFTANYGPTGIIGFGAGNAGTGGQSPFARVTLATNNTLTAGRLNIGLSSPADGNTSKTSVLLGQTNVINADIVNIASGKTQPTPFNPADPNPGALVKFNTGLVNPTVTLRGTAGGASRLGTFTIANGDFYTAGSPTQQSGIFDVTGGTLDARIDTLVLSVGANNGNTAGSHAIFTYNAGTLDANIIQMALEDRVTAVTNGASTGTLNVLGTGNLVVGSAGILLARRTTGTALSTGNLNIDGTATIGGDVRVEGTANALGNVTVNGTVDMTGHQLGTVALPLNNISLNAGAINNVTTIAGKTITLAAGATVTGNPTFAITDAGSLTTASPITLGNGGGLFLKGPVVPGTQSAGTVSGDVIANSGSRIEMGSATEAGGLQLFNNLTLNNGSALKFKISDNPGVNQDQLTVFGNLNVSGTVNLEIGTTGAGPQVGNTYTLINYLGTLTGNQTNFNVIGPGSRSTFSVVPTATTPSSIQVAVSGTPALALTWIGNVSNVWNTQGAANFRDLTLNPQTFFTLDSVTFDDISTNLSDVEVVGNLVPSSTTVSANRNYKFVGSGAITGGGNLTKNLAGTLVVANNNTYTGTTDITAGTVQVGDGGTTGSLGTGAVNNEGTLTFNRSDAHTFSNVIAGSGTVVKQGTNTLTLSGTNTYTGPTNITAGAVRPTSTASFGTLAGGGAVTVSNGAAIDLASNAGGANFGVKQFFVQGTGIGGTGVVVNTGATQQNVFQEVTLTGDATFNATSRFDIRSAGGNTATLDLAGHTLTKIGTNQFTLVAVEVTDGDIVANQGTFAMETTTSIPAALKPDMVTPYTITINDGVRFGFFGTGVETNQLNVSRQVVVNSAANSSVNFHNGSDDNVRLDSPITMNGNIVVSGTDDDTDGSIELAGAITEMGGPRSLTKNTRNVSLFLTGSAGYTGPTTINNGRVVLTTDNRIADASKLVLGGLGRLTDADNDPAIPVFNTGGFSETLNSLTVKSATSTTIDLGVQTGAPSILRFSASGNELWNGANPLAIINYEPGVDQIFFGTTNTGANAGLGVTQLRRITIDGQEVNLAANGELVIGAAPAALLKGDFDRNGSLTATDLPIMLSALTNNNNYFTAFPNVLKSDLLGIGDFDADGFFGNTDIQGFLTALGGGSGAIAAVPEPSTLVLAGLGLVGLLQLRRRRR